MSQHYHTLNTSMSAETLAMHTHWMKHAIALAKLGKNHTAPNPNVGCVIIRDQIMVGKGYHHQCGTPHAEIHALNDAKDQAYGSTLYVTLEPCSIFGNTPPCVQSIIDHGVKCVVCASLDPNPKINGQGIQQLQQHGIKVILNILKKEAQALNPQFFHFMIHHKPYVTLKWAMSLNGKQNPKENPSITNQASLNHSHQLREDHQAICVGAQTIVHDNPSLNVRYISSIKRQPLRIILDAKGSSPVQAHVYKTAYQQPTLVITTNLASKIFIEKLQNQGVKVLFVDHDQGIMNPSTILKTLADHSIISVLIEGGEQTRQSWIIHEAFQDIVIYIGNRFVVDNISTAHMDSGYKTPKIHIKKILRLQDDLCILGKIDKKGGENV